MRLIDADELIKAMSVHCRSETECINHFWYDENIISLICNAPTVSPKQGEWKLHGMIYYCSVCGHDYEQGGNNFCGNCGADMRGGAE